MSTVHFLLWENVSSVKRRVEQKSARHDVNELREFLSTSGDFPVNLCRWQLKPPKR